jgi:hypothetical protein
VAQPLDFEQPAIGGKTYRAQLGEIVQTPAHPEIIGVVDRSLCTQGPIFFVILLDPRMLVIDVERWGDVLRHDPGAETGASIARYAAVEDELDLLWSAEVEIFPDDLLEEHAAMHRSKTQPAGLRSNNDIRLYGPRW